MIDKMKSINIVYYKIKIITFKHKELRANKE